MTKTLKTPTEQTKRLSACRFRLPHRRAVRPGRCPVCLCSTSFLPGRDDGQHGPGDQEPGARGADDGEGQHVPVRLFLRARLRRLLSIYCGLTTAEGYGTVHWTSNFSRRLNQALKVYLRNKPAM